MDSNGTSDPYVLFTRTDPSTDKEITIHKSEIVKKVLDVTWKTFTVKLADFCGGCSGATNIDSLYYPIDCQVFDWDRMSKNDLIVRAHAHSALRCTLTGFPRT